MNVRLKIALVILANPLCILGSATSDKLSDRDAMQLFTQITGTFNINKSIEKGINITELPALKKRVEFAQNILLQENKANQQIFKQQTLVPLQGAFKFVTEKVKEYHQLYEILVQNKDIEWNNEQVFKLAKLFEADAKLVTKIYNQIAKQGKADTQSILAKLLEKADNNKAKALLLGIKFPQSRNLIPKTYRQRLLVRLIEQDINDPSQFDFQRATLGRVIRTISAKARKESAQYPERWTATIPITTFMFENDEQRAIYDDFKTAFTNKESYIRKEDLQEIINKRKYLDEDLIKSFISVLEKYQYHLENYRPSNWNITWGLTRIGDTAQYASHLEITKNLIQRLRDLYPSIMSDLDKQLQLHGKYETTDQLILMQASAYDAVLLGIIKEARELKRQYIQKEVKSEDSSWQVL